MNDMQIPHMRVSKNLMVVEISYNNPLRVFGKILLRWSTDSYYALIVDFNFFFTFFFSVL